MLKKTLPLFLFLVILSVTGICEPHTSLLSQKQSDLFLSSVDTCVEKALEAFQVPGIAVGVVVDGEVIVSKGYGFRDLDTQLPVTDETLFGIGSCTKAFTSFLLHQLVEEGRLAWDDPVVTHLPEFRLFDPQLTQEVTVRDLVAHRTGISRHDSIWYCKALEQETVLECLQHLKPTYALREKWYYNNFMYSIAGMVIERITGKSWEEVLATRIFNPLKMVHANASIETLKRSPDASLPYAEIDGALQQIPYHTLEGIEPAGAINANAAEMVKWVTYLLSSYASLDELFTMQMPFDPIDPREVGSVCYGYGLGWFISAYQGSSMLHHGGATNGFISEVCLIPEKNCGLVILSNNSSNGMFACGYIKNTLLDSLLNTEGTDWLACVKQAQQSYQAELKNPPPYETVVPTRALSEYVGTYDHPAYGILTIEEQGGHLVAHYGTCTITLNPTGEAIFKGQIRELLYFGMLRIVDVMFELSGETKQVSITFEPDYEPIAFRKCS